MSAEGWSTVVLPPASVVSVTLGPLLTGVMIGHLLLGVVCSQSATYFRCHFCGDTRLVRTIVMSLLILNILIGIMDSALVYQSTVLDFGDFDKFDLQPRELSTWTEPAVTALVALIAHTFYIFRCWKLMHSLPIILFLTLVALLAFASGIATSIVAFILGRLSKTPEAIVPGYTWLLSTGICDISIAIFLVLYFWRNSSAVHSTNAMLSRLRRTAIETGSLTAICALLNLILYATLAPAAYYLLIQYSMAHIYTLSVLYTLLSRQDLRQVISVPSGTSTGGLGRSSLLFTSVLNYSIHGNTTMQQHTKNIPVEDLDGYDDGFTENPNAIPMYHIRHHNSSR